ncbi:MULTISPECIES: OsmC family protein [Roseobacteraceae]|uniref:OsmC-like protein n=1 Tax=Pseudosulfitobacter pseudonitzschiae TaxID=1402135 RepID=A0A221K5J2_9RHOB|nr:MULTISPECIES: OsmC family protein [Roseobacteraceae]ASM74272.1 OsmC-like protein [Pseudosulfitobacter pseudonitzschiae]
MTETNQYHVGNRADAQPQTTQYTPSPFKKGHPPEPLYFEVNLVAEATGRQKKTGTVQVNIPGFSPLQLYCDEQTPVGDDTAPPPLAYFCAGIGFCLMTHLTDIYTARNIQITSLRLEQRVRFKTNLGTMRDMGHTTEGETEMVETHVLIDSPEPRERIQELLDEAEGACMAHFALRNPIPWSTRLVHNGVETINREG